MYCVKCGKQLPEGNAFCGFCGMKVPVDQTDGGFSSPQESAPRFTPQAKADTVAVEERERPVASRRAGSTGRPHAVVNLGIMLVIMAVGIGVILLLPRIFAGGGLPRMSEFSIEGSWQSVGDSGWGQAQPGAIVYFSEGNVNLYSPQDTYALYQQDRSYLLDVTGLFGGTTTFHVDILDDDNIDLHYPDEVDGSPLISLSRRS